MVSLEEILIYTYNPDHNLRSQAENALKQFLTTADSSLQLLQLTGNHAAHRDLRMASCILLKNKIRDFWSGVSGLSMTSEAKEQFKHQIVQFLLDENDNAVKGLLADIIRCISEYEYPENWPALVPTLLSKVQEENPFVMFNALLALRKLVKRYEYKPRENRKPLYDIVQVSFPLLLQLMAHIVDNNQIEAAHVMRMTLKIFWSATMYSLPEVNGIDVSLWFSLFSHIIQKNLPEGSEGLEPLGQPTDPEERKQWPWWKLKKWAVRIVMQFIQRYGNPRYCPDESKSFAQFFRANTAVTLLEPILNVLSAKAKGSFLTDDVHRMCITYVVACVEMSPTYKTLKPHLDFVLFQAIFPTLCLSNAEIALFTDDPAEFVRKIHDPTEDWLDPRVAAINLLQTLVRYRQKDVLPKFLPYLQSILVEYTMTPIEQRNYQKKDGVLVAFAAIVKILRENNAYRGLLTPFLITHVIPEFESPVPYIRARAFWTMDYFDENEYSEANVLRTIVMALLKGMTDPALPVQAASACSIRRLMDADGTTELLRPLLPQLVNEYFRIMDEMESDAVLSALQSIVENFGEEIKDLAPAMVGHLLRTFSQFSSAGLEDDEAAFSASQCLDTITAVLDAVQDHPLVLKQLETLLLPTMSMFLVGDDMFEYLENCMAMMSYFTYFPDGISPGMWSLCGPLLYAMEDWAFDYLGEIMTPVLNYVTKDISTFLQGSHNGVPFVSMLLKTVERTFVEDRSEHERDAKIGCTLLTALVSTCRYYLPGSIDGLMNEIVGTLLKRFTICRTSGLRIRLLEAVLACFYYNPSLTLNAMDLCDANASTQYFNLLFLNLNGMIRDVSERFVVLAFSTLLAQPAETLPVVVQQNLGSMFQQIIREIVLIEEEAAKPKKEDSSEDFEDVDEDGEGDNDDDDDGDDAAHDEDSNKARKGGSTSNLISTRLHVPDGGYDEEEDCLNAEDESYREALERMDENSKGKRYVGGELVDGDLEEEDEDDFDVTLCVESLDVLSFFVDTMQSVSARDQALASRLQGSLNSEDVGRLNEILRLAAERKVGK